MIDPNDTRNTSPRPGSPLWNYVVAISAAGAAVLALAALRLHDAGGVVRHPLFWVIAVMILVGEIWPIVTPGRSRPESPAVSITFSFAALLYWGFPIAILLRTAAAVAVGPAQRTSAYRTVFNAAQEALSLGAAGLVLALAGVDVSPSRPWQLVSSGLPVVLLAALAYFAVNFGLVVVAVALYSRAPVLRSIAGNLPYQALVHLVLLAAAPLVAVVMATRSAIMVALFAFPLAAIYINAAMSVRREHQAHHDELTGLSNRKLLLKRSDSALSAAATSGSMVGFLLLDLDRFKEINDTLGHAVGDRLLQIISHRLVHSVRPGDVVARLGGDEFAVLLPAVKEPNAAREVASRLRAALAEPVRLEAMMFDIQASVGVAIYPDDAASFDQLMQRADVAMYLAKERRSGIERYSAAADRNSPDRLVLAGDLGGAIHRGEIELVFQPKVKLSDGAVLGMEALARWRHPRRGLMAAADFIAIAEQSHLISELTGQVIDKALDQAARWWADGLPIQVCVNVAARDLVGIRLADIAAAALRRHGLPPSALRLDINEQVLTGKQVQAAGTVRGLVDLGIEVSLDDFGTGYSSLPQLTRLGITEVKLDPTLVRGLSDRPDQNMTVQSMIRLAESLGIRSVAEGVETDADASALRLMGCNGAQGWYFGRPVTAEHATTWLAENYRPGPPGGDAGDVAGGIVTASGIVTVGGIAAAADGSSAVDVAAGSAPAGSAPPVPASGRAAGAVPAGSGRLAGAAPAV